MNPVRLIIRREYLQAIRKPTFWASILLLPLFLVVISYVSNRSTSSAQQKLKEQASKADVILIVDEAKLIAPALLKQTPTLQPSQNAAQAEEAVREHLADAAIIYPADIAEQHQIRIIANQQDASPLSGSRFDDLSKALLQQSLLSQLPDSQTAQLVTTPPKVKDITYRQGRLYSFGEDAPYIALIAIYILIIITSTNMFLLSVTEEKENRAVEVVMTVVKPMRLITGKIIGLSLVALTQVFVLITLSLTALLVMHNKLPFDLSLSQITIHPLGLALGVFYMLSGILFIAAIMVGIGSVVPTAKEAAGFVSVAIIGTIAPIYFISTILQDPAGPVAQFTSFFPLTAPVILPVRFMFEALAGWEIAASIVLMLVMVFGGFFISSHLFKRGAFSYRSRLSWREIWHRS